MLSCLAYRLDHVDHQLLHRGLHSSAWKMSPARPAGSPAAAPAPTWRAPSPCGRPQITGRSHRRTIRGWAADALHPPRSRTPISLSRYLSVRALLQELQYRRRRAIDLKEHPPKNEPGLVGFNYRARGSRAGSSASKLQPMNAIGGTTAVETGGEGCGPGLDRVDSLRQPVQGSGPHCRERSQLDRVRPLCLEAGDGTRATCGCETEPRLRVVVDRIDRVIREGGYTGR
ncbi:hypothetical protein BDK51DRAFT_41069 [Blyttiomyces helicus]|uniref:Uncharacterized protein n=1 Tax=Blyttiomyces helicus TaxID=388810 RepID=A0A4P9WE63_9FUNG|nr:hypothetical protein BDK51DRAFT_41069 [Blyttiomyces helicus]|eukprot:RKO89983.1 hypothetical protein BDK51DRAFT_41069 [Blyttiomyces helicus]